MRKTERWKKFTAYMRRTIKNKICALILIGIGVMMLLIERDATILLILSCIGIPLFITNKNCIGN